MKPIRRDRTDFMGFGLPSLNRVRDQLNSLFDKMAPAMGEMGEVASMPAVDVYEDQDNVVVRAEVPGLSKEDLNVTLNERTLTLSGERKEERREQKEGRAYCSECYYGRFYRTVSLPAEVDSDRVQAEYKDGVLRVTMAKKETAKGKQIPVNGL